MSADPKITSIPKDSVVFARSCPHCNGVHICFAAKDGTSVTYGSVDVHAAVSLAEQIMDARDKIIARAENKTGLQ